MESDRSGVQEACLPVQHSKQCTTWLPKCGRHFEAENMLLFTHHCLPFGETLNNCTKFSSAIIIRNSRSMQVAIPPFSVYSG